MSFRMRSALSIAMYFIGKDKMAKKYEFATIAMLVLDTQMAMASHALAALDHLEAVASLSEMRTGSGARQWIDQAEYAVISYGLAALQCQEAMAALDEN